MLVSFGVYLITHTHALARAPHQVSVYDAAGVYVAHAAGHLDADAQRRLQVRQPATAAAAAAAVSVGRCEAAAVQRVLKRAAVAVLLRAGGGERTGGLHS